MENLTCVRCGINENSKIAGNIVFPNKPIKIELCCSSKEYGLVKGFIELLDKTYCASCAFEISRQINLRLHHLLDINYNF